MFQQRAPPVCHTLLSSHFHATMDLKEQQAGHEQQIETADRQGDQVPDFERYGDMIQHGHGILLSAGELVHC